MSSFLPFWRGRAAGPASSALSRQELVACFSFVLSCFAMLVVVGLVLLFAKLRPYLVAGVLILVVVYFVWLAAMVRSSVRGRL